MTGQELTHYDARLAAKAAALAEQEHLQGGKFLSVRGGTFKLGDEELGDQVCVIVLDGVKENNYYPDPWDPDNPVSPTCYALGRGAGGLEPHPSMQTFPNYFAPQANSCATCPHYVWGSGDKGKGKACKERRRLALLPAGIYVPRPRSRDFDLQLFTDPKQFKTMDISFFRVPTMSVKNWSRYTNECGQMSPPKSTDGVITRMYIVPDAHSQYRIHFEMIDAVAADLMPAVMDRVTEVENSIIFGYQPPPEKPAQQAGSLKGLRRAR